MKGRFELWIEHQIDVGKSVIRIDWLDIDRAEAEDRVPDRIAETLFDAGYHPDGRGCAPDVQEAYVTGQKVNGKYIRLPQEIWMRVR